MARQLRIEYEGAFYRATSKGNLRQNILFEGADREEYLEILKRIKERHGYLPGTAGPPKQLSSELDSEERVGINA